MVEETQLATVRQESDIVDYAHEREKIQAIVKKVFRVNIDYGVIPGTQKQSLFQPGAEKIAKLFGLMPKYELLKEVEDFETGFFYYKYKCVLTHFQTGKFAGEADRSCNSHEKKYKNSYDKPGLVNTIQAMAQKRAFVASVKVATGASEIFGEDEIDVGDIPVTKKKTVAPENPEKANAMKRLHALAAERGFKHEGLSAGAKKRFEVESLSECTVEQLTDMIDDLEMKWEVVGEGNKPQKIGTDAVEGEVVKGGETETVNCYECGKPGAPTDGDHAYFTNQECKDKYWHKKENPEKKNWQFSGVKK